MSPIEANKQLVRKFFAAVEDGDFEAFDEIVAEDYNDHLPGQTRARNTEDLLQSPRTALPGCPAADLADDCSRATASRCSMRYRAPTAASSSVSRPPVTVVDASAFQLYRIADGRLAEHWEAADLATPFKAIGPTGLPT